MKRSLRDYWEIINYNYEQIRFAEIKSSVIVSVYSLLFTFAYTIDILDDENVYSFEPSSIFDYIVYSILIPTIYFVILSFINCVRCFLPRLSKSSLNSPLFFGDIALGYKDFNSYSKELEEVMGEDEVYKRHMSHMVYATGKIAFTKFMHVNKAIKALIKAVILFGLFIVCNFLKNI